MASRLILMNDNNFNASSNEELLQEAKRVLIAESQALTRSAGLLDDGVLRAMHLMHNASRVFCCGVGKSGLIAQKIAATLASIGVAAQFLHPADAMHGDLGAVGKGSAVLLLSKSGSSSEIIALLPFLRQREAVLVGLIGNRDSYLAQHVDVFIDASVESEACFLNTVPTSSTTVALALGDALSIGLMRLRNYKHQDFAHHHPHGQLGRNLHLRVGDVMHANSHIPIIDADASFRSALIVASEYGLGCVCVCDAEKKLIGIVTDGDVRRILQNHEDIREIHVGEVMTRSPLSIRPSALLAEALSMMEERERQISVLPVVDESHHCVGVIRVHDILRTTAL